MIYRDDIRDDVAAALAERGFAGVPVMAIEAGDIVRIDYWPGAFMPADLGQLQRHVGMRASSGWAREREGIIGVILRDLKARHGNGGGR